MRALAIPSEQGTEDKFAGEVRLYRLLQQKDRVSVSVVHFTDGARTNWHVHPEEQILYIVQGECRAGTESLPEMRFKAGEAVYLPPNENHWHGAVPGTNMTHISITTGDQPTWDGPPPA